MVPKIWQQVINNCLSDSIIISLSDYLVCLQPLVGIFSENKDHSRMKQYMHLQVFNQKCSNHFLYQFLVPSLISSGQFKFQKYIKTLDPPKHSLNVKFHSFICEFPILAAILKMAAILILDVLNLESLTLKM